MQGADLAALIPGGRIDTTLTSFGEALIYYGEQKAVLADRWKLIYDPATGEKELYDLASDPGEQFNIARSREEMRDSLTAALLAWSEDSRAANRALPQETGSRAVVGGALRQQLRAMGYLQ